MEIAIQAFSDGDEVEVILARRAPEDAAAFFLEGAAAAGAVGLSLGRERAGIEGGARAWGSNLHHQIFLGGYLEGIVFIQQQRKQVGAVL